MRGSVCAYWLRLGLLLVCRSLRLSVAAGWVCVLFALLCFAPVAGWMSGRGWCRPDGRTNSCSQLVWIHRWLSACEQWLDGFPGCSRA